MYPRVSVGTKVTVTYQTFTTSGGATAGASKGPMGSLTNALPKVSIPNLFMYGDDDPPVPSKRVRARSKGAAPSKGAQRTTTKNAAVIETAATP